MATELTSFEGKVKEPIQKAFGTYLEDPALLDAELTRFEETFGISPRVAISGIVGVAAEKCRIKDCELSAQIEDNTRYQPPTGMPPNEFDDYKERTVDVRVTCPRACSRQACQTVIRRTTGHVERFLQEATRGVPQTAQNAYMQPIQQKAFKIKADANAKADRLLAEAASKLDDVGTKGVAAFLDRYGLTPAQPIAEQQ